MKILIVYKHHESGSFCAAMLARFPRGAVQPWPRRDRVGAICLGVQFGSQGRRLDRLPLPEALQCEREQWASYLTQYEQTLRNLDTAEPVNFHSPSGCGADWGQKPGAGSDPRTAIPQSWGRSMTDERGSLLPQWNSADLPALLTLDEIAPLHYVSRFGEANRNGRSFGGQILGQAIAAAGMSVDPARQASMLQLLFVQGTDPSRAVEFEVTKLQDGKRFSSRHVRGTQGDRIVCDATASFALQIDSPSHSAAAPGDRGDPDQLEESVQLPEPWAQALMNLSGYGLDHKACIDFRMSDVDEEVNPDRANARLRFWIRVRQPLPQAPAMHAAAFAFLSDWWLNYCSLGLHLRELSNQRLYVSSLNHGVWFHRPFAADDWFFVDSRSPSAAFGRGFCQATVYNRAGSVVATMVQDCLMAFA